jgi:uncharacterized protein YjbI with pentapeptide repeats
VQPDLARANLHRAKLSLANLSESNLFGANFSEADLNLADLDGAQDLTQSQLNETIGDKNTKLPRGFTRPDSWSH